MGIVILSRMGIVSFPSTKRGVDGLAIDLADGGDILGGFESSLDLETRDAAFQKLRNIIHCGEILRREEITAVAEIPQSSIDNEVIGHPTGLGTLASICTALAERFTGEALTGVGDTQRPMDKYFQ